MRLTDSVSRIALLAAASLFVATASAKADPLPAPNAAEPAATEAADTGTQAVSPAAATATPVLDEIVEKVKAETAEAAPQVPAESETAAAPKAPAEEPAQAATQEADAANTGGETTTAVDESPSAPSVAEQMPAQEIPAETTAASETAPATGDNTVTGSLAGEEPAQATETAEAEPAPVAAPESLFTAAGPALRDSLSVSLESAIATLRAENPKSETVALIADLYTGRKFEPIFSNENGFNARGEAVATALQHADEDGLDPAAYQLTGDSAAAREISLVRAAVLYGHQAYSGRVDAGRIHPLVTVEPPKISTEEILSGLVKSDDAGAYLVALNPPHDGYKGLRVLLAKMRAEEGKEKQVAIPAGQMLRPGMSDDRVPLLRERFGLAAPAEGDPQRYDEATVEAVKEFQAAEGLTRDGIIGPNTLEFLNRGHAADIASIESNMERWRWMPRSLGKRYVYVNVPEFLVRIIENGQVQYSTRVVVGTPRNQTPIFDDEMEYIDVNPSWNVPRSIAVKEMLPEIKRDPDYFSKTNFQVVTDDGRVVDPEQINWQVYDGSSLPYRFRQPPGDGNALGRIKFMFPNKHNVYLHDTPSKSLFARESRAYSHGCVRVQNPIDFATALLKRDTAVSAATIEQRLKTGQPGELGLSAKIPVHLVYFTAWANPDGSLGRMPDIYQHDAATQAAMRGDYSYYDRSLATYRAQKVAKFDPQAAQEAEQQARVEAAPPRRVGLFGVLFGSR
ncbi:MAG: L,D-transpeptidase family protein [Rhodobiaceae bacterium]|nr:L,D-transpeptidase family protein [Rhodobiaceae bacterium]MCC0057223.1 L,D-transpeptidase family protein [Rhodobiaceae bacterium]